MGRSARARRGTVQPIPWKPDRKSGSEGRSIARTVDRPNRCPAGNHAPEAHASPSTARGRGTGRPAARARRLHRDPQAPTWPSVTIRSSWRRSARAWRSAWTWSSRRPSISVPPVTRWGGPEDGTIDPDYDAFGSYVKSILRNFLEMGFGRIYVIIMHQGMEAPLALAFKKAAAELSFEMVLAEGKPRGWWADARLSGEARRFGGIQVYPMILPAASPPAGGDHAGYNETSFLLATRPELVDQGRLDENAPWYCRQRRRTEQLDGERGSWRGHGRGGRRCVGRTTAALNTNRSDKP